MECADWLEGGFDSAQARSLMTVASGFLPQIGCSRGR
jgi:hypothetical protein